MVYLQLLGIVLLVTAPFIIGYVVDRFWTLTWEQRNGRKFPR